MTNKLKLICGSAVLAFALTQTVNAVPITGSINFNNGSVTLNNPISSATAITAFGAGSVVSSAFGTTPTGSFVGTAGQSVTFLATGFTFLPTLSPNPVIPLWTFTMGASVYSFDLTSVVSSVGVGPSLNLAGNGMLHISNFDDTIGTWTLSTTGSGQTIFGFVAGNAAVPDGGTTLALLGMALSGVALMRKKLTA